MTKAYQYRTIDERGDEIAAANTLAGLYPESDREGVRNERRSPTGEWVEISTQELLSS